MKQPTRSLRQPRPLCSPLLAVLGLACALPVLAGECRYPERPWGIDGPAGRCVVCHSLERGGPFRDAPNPWGVVGDDKARDRGSFVHSGALIKKGGTWTEEDLDEFLADASHFTPGSSKSIRVTDDDERREIIAYLKAELVG